MSRWMMPFLVAMLAIPSMAEAAVPSGKAAARHAASQLPPGLPRATYKFRTTVAPATPYPTAQSLIDGPDVLFTPSIGYPGPWYARPAVIYWNGWTYGYGCGLNSYGNPWC